MNTGMVAEPYENPNKGHFVILTLTEIEKELPFHLNGVGVDYVQEPVNRPYGYPGFQWLQNASGQGLVRVGGQEFVLGGETGLLLYPGTPHTYRGLEGEWVVNWITFDGFHLASFLGKIGMEEPGPYICSAPEVIERHIRRAHALCSTEAPGHRLDASVTVYSLLIDLFKYARHAPTEDEGVRGSSRLSPAFALIAEAYHRPIPIGELAEAAGVSVQHFCRLFRRETGVRPMEYINRYRVRHAKRMLVLFPDMPISRIAGDSGFESESYFSRVFRSVTGMSAGEYRAITVGAEQEL